LRFCRVTALCRAFNFVLAYPPAHVELGQVPTWQCVLVSCTTHTMRRTRCWRRQRARWQTCSWNTWTSSSCIGQSLATRALPWSRPSRRLGRRALPLLPASVLQRHSAGTLMQGPILARGAQLRRCSCGEPGWHACSVLSAFHCISAIKL